jgi:hypothetical protein
MVFHARWLQVSSAAVLYAQLSSKSPSQILEEANAVRAPQWSFARNLGPLVDSH